MIRSKDTGAANAFRTSVSGGGPTNLAYDPSSGVNNAIRSQTAANAAATINGLPVSSATNALVDVLDGVTLTLNDETTAPVTVSVKPDTEAIKKTLQDFAAAYTELAKLIATDTKYDAATKTAGPLQGDSAVIGLQSRLRAMMGATSGASSVYARLSDVGFEQQQDGTPDRQRTPARQGAGQPARAEGAVLQLEHAPTPAWTASRKRFRIVAERRAGHRRRADLAHRRPEREARAQPRRAGALETAWRRRRSAWRPSTPRSTRRSAASAASPASSRSSSLSGTRPD